jgi:hypothetical protein
MIIGGGMNFSPIRMSEVHPVSYSVMWTLSPGMKQPEHQSGLFYNPFSITEYIASNRGMTDELERIWMKAVMSKLDSYPDICMEALRETMKTAG